MFGESYSVLYEYVLVLLYGYLAAGLFVYIGKRTCWVPTCGMMV